MSERNARLFRKLARKSTDRRAKEATTKFWKRLWGKLNRRERTAARTTWAHNFELRLPA
jgi:hypothetical protein